MSHRMGFLLAISQSNSNTTCPTPWQGGAGPPDDDSRGLFTTLQFALCFFLMMQRSQMNRTRIRSLVEWGEQRDTSASRVSQWAYFSGNMHLSCAWTQATHTPHPPPTLCSCTRNRTEQNIVKLQVTYMTSYHIICQPTGSYCNYP